MRIAFQHANPQAGNESVLLRFDHDTGETVCVLVDAGHGVDVDALLGPDDRLAAICLTHAHLDHYAELAAAHRDDVPILTSPATAAILEDVFSIAGVEYGVETTTDVAEAITPIDTWTELTPGVDVHPVPAGHVPGAVGFLLRVSDDDVTHQLLASGDVTRRRAGGFPGFDPEGVVDVDVLFLPAATSDTFEDGLTEALGTALERAHGGAPTLVTTSGLVGAHVAYLLSALGTEYDLQVPIRVVGQVAKLYQDLDYDCPGVEPITEFTNTDECLAPGTITIAGPEIPRERSSGRLFGVLKDDPSACVIQLIGSGGTPLTEGRCTIHDFELVNHPTRETLVALHDAVDPTQTVITHSHGGAKGAFNDLSSVVWGAGDTDEYTLFDDGQWQLPPWMHGSINRQAGQRIQQLVGSDILGSLSLPSLARHDEPNLEAEGIDIAQLETQLHRGPTASDSPDAPTPPADVSTTTQHTHESTMTTNGQQSTADDDTEADAPRPAQLVRTTGPVQSDDLDPAIQTALAEGTITEADVVAMAEALADGEHHDETADEEGETQTAGDETPEQETGVRESEPADERSTNGTDESTREDEADQTDTHPAPDEPTQSAQSSETPAVTTTQHPPETSQQNDAEDTAHEHPTDDALTLRVNPLALALAQRAMSNEQASSPTHVLEAAVETYIVALLAGDATGDETERVDIDVTASAAVDEALNQLIDESTEFESTAGLVAEGVARAVGGERVREVEGLGTYRRQLEAIATNDNYIFDDVSEVVDAALVWVAAQ